MEPNIGENVSRERIRKAVIGDINRANDFYTSKIEPVRVTDLRWSPEHS